MGYNLSGMNFSAGSYRRNLPLFFRLGLLSLLFPLCACRSGPIQEMVQVSCASSLRYVMPEIAEEYETVSGTDIAISFASSGSIYQQIQSGAPVDLFCSADRKRIDMLLAEGFLEPSSVAIYALGNLVLCCSQNVVQMPESVRSLADPCYGLIAWANPDLAPYGLAAKQVLQASEIENVIEKKVVYGENVAQVLTYLMNGEVDCAFLPLSFVIWSGNRYLEVSPEMYDPIEQVMAVTRNGHNLEGGRDFARFILGPKSRAILGSHGFSLPVDPKRQR
jgi:molybdate transport system substrate-binding protein